MTVAAAWIGAMLAAGQIEMPPSLHAYAGSLAAKALLTSWLAHALMFALRYCARSRSKVVLIILMFGLSGVGIATSVAPGSRGMVVRAGDFLISNPGPFGVSRNGDWGRKPPMLGRHSCADRPPRPLRRAMRREV